MIGTTRSEESPHNRFRKLGFIEYNYNQVRNSLFNVFSD